jgi:hypothetical protein
MDVNAKTIVDESSMRAAVARQTEHHPRQPDHQDPPAAAGGVLPHQRMSTVNAAIVLSVNAGQQLSGMTTDADASISDHSADPSGLGIGPGPRYCPQRRLSASSGQVTGSGRHRSGRRGVGHLDADTGELSRRYSLLPVLPRYCRSLPLIDVGPGFTLVNGRSERPLHRVTIQI